MASRRKRQLKRTIRPVQLELLAAMQREKTLSSAAKAVGLAQPSASRLLRELEDRTGIEFFEKFGRTLRPTLSGGVLLEKASRLVADLDRLEEELEAVERGLIGSVSIGAGVAPCFVLVPRAIADLTRGNSRISVKLKEGGMDELVDELRAGQIDIIVGRIESQHDDLEFEALYDPTVRIVCGPAHPLSRRRNMALEEALGAQWLLPEQGTAMRRGIENLFRTEGARPGKCLIESSSIQANVAILNSCELLWVLSADIAAHLVQGRQLKILPVPAFKGPGPVLLARMKDRVPAEPVRRLQQSLRAAARSLAEDMRLGSGASVCR